MPRSLALFRAVNVSGTGRLPMAELREHLAARGFEDVVTYIASGNLLLTGPLAGPELEARLEAEAASRFDLRTDVIVRDLDAWTRLVAENPFPELAAEAPARMSCMVLKSPAADGGWERLQAEAPGREPMRLIGRRLYLFHVDGAADSKLTAGFIERRLSTRGTARNWNTVLKLHALLAQQRA